jgi:hypothetical protein
MKPQNRLVLFTGLALAAVISLTGCSMTLGGGASAPSSSATHSASATPSPTSSPKANKGSKTSAKEAAALSKALKAQLDASRIQSNVCDTIVKNAGGTVVDGVYTLKIDQLPSKNGKLPVVKDDGNPAHLQWSTSLALPLQGSTPSEMYAYAQLDLCTKPLVGVSFAHLMAHKTISDGSVSASVLAAQNSNWLKFADVDVDRVNNLANGFMPLLKVPTGQTPTNKQYTNAANKAREYADMASKLVYLLAQYQLGDVQPLNATASYEAAAPSADGAPEVAIVPDTKSALVFYYTSKTACAPIDVIGFNTGDTRPEQGTINQSCATTPPTITKVTPGCKVTATNSCKPPHTPTCEEKGNCSTPTCVSVYGAGWSGTYPVCKSPPSGDPYPSGNAPIGGGKNADPGPGAAKPAPIIVPYVPTQPTTSTAPAVTTGGPTVTTPTDTSTQSSNGNVTCTGDFC